MSKNNFQCLKCGCYFSEQKYSMSFIAGVPIYKKDNKMLLCPECNESEIENISEFNGFCVNYGKFASSSNEDKKKILKKRARDHSEKKMKERKIYLDREFTGRTRDVDF